MRLYQPTGFGPLLLAGLLTALLAIALPTEPALAASPRPAWVIPESLNVRSGPRTESKKIGALTRGTKVYVISFANKWCWCKTPGGKGWIAEWLLQFSAEEGRKLAASAGKAPTSTSTSPATPPAWIKVSAANVRSAPGLGGKSYGTLDSGTKVYVLARRGEWAKCKTPGGDGWIRNDLLEYNMTAGRKLAGTSAAPKPAAPATKSAAGKAFVTGDQVYLRSGPGSRFDKKATLIKGQTLYLSGTSGMWRKVTVHGGNSGWVAAWLIKEEKAKSVPGNADVPDVARTDKVLTAWVTADEARVRERPSSESRVKFTLYQGTKIKIAAVCGHWAKLRTMSGNYGWIAGWLIKFVPPGTAVTATEAGEKVEVNVGWVARPVVNLRTAPSTDAPTSGDARLGTRLLIIGRKPGWYKVALEDGNIGWMSSRLLDTRAERQVRYRVATAGKEGAKSRSSANLARATMSGSEGFPSPTSEGGSDNEGGGGLGAKLVEIAMGKCGNSYVTGGLGPSVFDCQGLMNWVHRQLGVQIGYGVDGQFHRGQPISRDDLQPGDVVFFENTYKSGLSHVGMYIGKGNFVHAANRRCGVKVDALSSDYYARRYVGARRMY